MSFQYYSIADSLLKLFLSGRMCYKPPDENESPRKVVKQGQL